MSQEPTYVGIDVAKEQIDIAVRPTGRSWSVPYNGVAVDELIVELGDLDPVTVTGARLRQVHGAAGEDRPTGRSGSGVLWRSSAST